jgi:hypothetical protein
MENALIRPGDQGEGGRSGPLIENWRDAQLVRRALREGWGLTAEERRVVVEQMLYEVEHNPEARARIAAARVLVAADAVDARREGNSVSEQSGEVAANVAALRETIGRLPCLCRSSSALPGRWRSVASGTWLSSSRSAAPSSTLLLTHGTSTAGTSRKRELPGLAM